MTMTPTTSTFWEAKSGAGGVWMVSSVAVGAFVLFFYAMIDRTLWRPRWWRRSEAEGGDGGRGRNEATARRAVPLVDGQRRRIV